MNSTLSTDIWDYIDPKYKQLRDSLEGDKRKSIFDYFHNFIYDNMGNNFFDEINKTKIEYQTKIEEMNKQMDDEIENNWTGTKNSINQTFNQEIYKLESEQNRRVKDIVEKCSDKRKYFNDIKDKISNNVYLVIPGLFAIIALFFLENFGLFILATIVVAALIYGRYHFNKQLNNIVLIEDNKCQKINEKYESKINLLKEHNRTILEGFDDAYYTYSGRYGGSFSAKLTEVSTGISNTDLDDIQEGLKSTLSGMINSLKNSIEKAIVKKEEKKNQLENARDENVKKLESKREFLMSHKPEIVSDKQIDQWIEDDIEYAYNKSLKYLCLDGGEVPQNWLFKSIGLLQEKTPLKTKDTMDIVKVGNDYKIRYPVHYLTWYMSSEFKLAIFSCFFDIMKEEMSGMYSDEFFYSDVVSVSQRTVDRTVEIHGKNISIPDIPELTLTVSSGDSMSIAFEAGMKSKLSEIFNSEKNINEIDKVSNDEYEATLENRDDFIKSIRQLLRQFKTTDL